MFDLEPPFAATEQWESLGPPGTVWQEVLDDASGELYYWNKTTGETTWECPWDEEPFIFFEEVEGSEGKRSGASSRQGRASRAASTRSAGKQVYQEDNAKARTAADDKTPDETNKSASQANAEEDTSQNTVEGEDRNSEDPTTPPPETPPPGEEEQAQSKQGSVRQDPPSSPPPPSEPQQPRVLPSKLFRLHTPQTEASSLPLDETTPPPPPPRPVPSIEAIGKLLDSPTGSGRATTGSMATLLALKQHTKRMQRR